MFGPGVYLAESSTKADEYARDDVGGEYDGLYAVLVCRALLGRSYVTEQAGDFSDRVLSGEFEHVLGDREKAVGTFREFIFFHEASIYPEYAVFYRREKDGQILPPPPRVEAPAMERMERLRMQGMEAGSCLIEGAHLDLCRTSCSEAKLKTLVQTAAPLMS